MRPERWVYEFDEGDPESIEFFRMAGLDYVSCSPYRLPIARDAAAQAAVLHSATAPGRAVAQWSNL